MSLSNWLGARFLTIAQEGRLDPANMGSVSVLAIVRTNTGGGSFNVYNIFQATGGNNNSLRLYMYNGGNASTSRRFGYSKRHATTDSEAEIAMPNTAAWYAVAVVDTAAGFAPRMYVAPIRQPFVEGTYVTQVVGVGAVTSEMGAWRIGTNFDGSRPWFQNGDIFAFMAWSRPLSLRELCDHAMDPWRQGDQLLHFVFAQNVVNGGTGQVNTDLSPSRRHAVVNTGPLTKSADPPFAASVPLSFRRSRLKFAGAPAATYLYRRDRFAHILVR